MQNFYQRSPGPGFGMGFPGSTKRPEVTYVLIAANVVVLLAMELAGGSTNTDVLLDFGAMFGPKIADGQYWRLFTAMFLHVGFVHLAFNLFGLWIFGRTVEAVFGRFRFVLLYVIAGLFGSMVSYLLSPIAVAAGASGAVFGIMGALAAYFAVQRHVMGSAARQNLYGLLALAGINLVFGLLTPGIDNWAHLGGFVAGFALGYVLSPEYDVLRSLMGRPMGLTERAGRWVRRLWVVPVAVIILILGVWAGTSTLPANAITYVQNAERLIEQGDFESAGAELEKALTVDGPATAVGQAYFLRAEMRLLSGDTVGAIDDLAWAVRLADGETRQAAVELFVRIRDGS